jgi:hypothetical protein
MIMMTMMIITSGVVGLHLFFSHAGSFHPSSLYSNACFGAMFVFIMYNLCVAAISFGSL